MELNEFVTQTLVQIVKGIEHANQELSGKKVTDAEDKAFLLAYSGGDHPLGRHIEFDVAVTTKLDGKATAGASAKLFVVDLGAKGSTSTSKENVSRVRFEVLVKEHRG